MSTTCCKFCSCLLLCKVLCTGGKLSLKNKNCPGWRTSQVDQRFFFDPFLLPFPALHGSPMSLLQLGPRAAVLLCRPCCPVGAEASRRRREQIQLSTDLESRMHGCSPERVDSGAQGAECSQTLFSRADSLPTVLPRVMKTSALDSAVKTRISRRK